MRKIKLLITGGGTGGHTSPAISIIKYIRKKSNELNIDFDILYIGSEKGIEKVYAQREEIPYQSIKTGKLRRQFTLKNVADMFKVFVGFLGSMKIISRFKPDVIFSTGGYVSVPVMLASGMKKIPSVIHEQTVNVGLANKVSSKFANKICITFESSKKYFPPDKVMVTGIPLREEIFNGDKNKCYEIFNLDKNLPLIYITGGSQGSKFINDNIKKILPQLLKQTNIIHQCGGGAIHNSYEELAAYKAELKKEYQTRYIVKDYIYDHLNHIFAGASLIIGRSGAGTVSECIALTKPTIFIPLPGTTKNEQVENAKYAEKLGGALVLYQQELTPEILYKELSNLLNNKEHLKLMSKNFKVLDFGNANQKILDLILQLADNTNN